jgi:hypothetical protein
MQNPETPAPTQPGSIFVSADWTRYSFSDIFYLSGESARGSPRGGTVRGGPDTIPIQVTNNTDSAGARAHSIVAPAGVVYAMADRVGELPAIVARDNSSVFQRQSATLPTAAGVLFRTTDIPRPAGWITLLCGLAVIAFMARRKRNPHAG